MLVKPGVNSKIMCSHLLLGKLLDLLDSSRGPVIEADAVEMFVEVDGVLPGHHFNHGGTLTLLELATTGNKSDAESFLIVINNL